MGKATTAEVIKEITRNHLEEHNGLLFGQCVTAVGWIGGTVPDCKGITELPMTDVAASGFAVGAALMGRRPIFVMRYQGFVWYNCSSIINYAARSKQVWGRAVPLFVRCIGMEGIGIGHTTSSCLHGVFVHVPGIKVATPMTPLEYREVWKNFMDHDDPIFVSEHRKSFSLTEELPDQAPEKPKITVFAISAARLNVVEAIERLKVKGVNVDLFNLVWLKPLKIDPRALESLKKTGLGLVIDSDFEMAGSSQMIAYELMHKTGAKVFSFGLEDRVCGVAERLENITPSAAKIEARVLELLQRSL